jgi:uncharacterized damage-inducible protein DinB
MSARAQELAEQFERANEELIAAISRCSDEGWKARCADTGWTAAVQADHLGAGQAFIADRIGRIARGEADDPLPMAVIEQANEQRAGERAGCSREEAIAQLRENGAAMAAMIRGLSDEQLARTGKIVAEVPSQSVEGWIAYLSIGEIERHGGRLREAVGA